MRKSQPGGNSTSPEQKFLLFHLVRRGKEAVEAAKELGQEDRTGGSFADVDEGLADLPSGYGESRIVLMPRSAMGLHLRDVSNEHKEDLRRQGGQLALRIYDVTDINLGTKAPIVFRNTLLMNWHAVVSADSG